MIEVKEVCFWWNDPHKIYQVKSDDVIRHGKEFGVIDHADGMTTIIDFDYCEVQAWYWVATFDTKHKQELKDLL